MRRGRRQGGIRCGYKTFVDPLGCLVAISGLAGHLSAAAAQAPEKRIALVVGNAAYAKSPLATAANDAGLIAQTLQAAGFDVIGAAISTATRCARVSATSSTRPKPRGRTRSRWCIWPATGCTGGRELLRAGRFRDQPRYRRPDRGAADRRLYPSACLAPIESRHCRAGRGAATAFRQRRYRRRSRFGRGGAEHADRVQRGARNRGAGRAGAVWHLRPVAGRDDQDRRIAAAGVFNRVRLRVNEAAKGAQVPWDSQKVDAAFTFFERAPDAPAAPPWTRLPPRSKPIRDSACRTPTPRRWSATRCRPMRIFSRLSRRSDGEAGEGDRGGAARGDHLAPHLPRRHPERLLVVSATLSARAACRRRAPPPDHSHRAAGAAAGIRRLDYDVPPPPPEELIYIDRPVLAFGDPEFDFFPPPPAPVYYCRRRRRISWCWSRRRRRSGCSSCRSRSLWRSRSMCGRRAMWRRRRTTSSLPTSITAPSSTT